MRIGLYFGSFNPIHIGHIQLAQYIQQYCALGEVWLVVSPNNPLKQQTDLWDEQLRLHLTELAIADIPGLKACDFEFNLPRPSYTIDTLKAMTAAYPDHEFYLIIGSDNVAIFHKWKNYKQILRNYRILVYPREDDDIEALKQKYPRMQVITDAPLFPVSSTMIRERLQRGEDVSDMVSPQVAEELRKY